MIKIIFIVYFAIALLTYILFFTKLRTKLILYSERGINRMIQNIDKIKNGINIPIYFDMLKYIILIIAVLFM